MAALAFTLLPFLPLGVWALLTGWSTDTTEGEELLAVPVPILARLKRVSIPMSLGLVFMLVGIIAGETHWWLLGPLLLLYLITLAIPTRYTLTTAGIRTGRGQFRRWTEFAGVRRSPFGATLVGSQRVGSYPIFLSGSREDDDFVLTLKNLVRNSYKGQTIELDRMRDELSGHHSDGDTGSTSSINH